MSGIRNVLCIVTKACRRRAHSTARCKIFYCGHVTVKFVGNSAFHLVLAWFGVSNNNNHYPYRHHHCRATKSIAYSQSVRNRCQNS